jgi:signal transduction histidine kinase
LCGRRQADPLHMQDPPTCEITARGLHLIKRNILVPELISDALSKVVVPDNVTVCIGVGDAERLNGDPVLLSRVFANLIQNNVQAIHVAEKW